MKQKAEAIRPRLLTFGTNVLLAKPCDKAEKMRHLFYKLEFVSSFLEPFTFLIKTASCFGYNQWL